MHGCRLEVRIARIAKDTHELYTSLQGLQPESLSPWKVIYYSSITIYYILMRGVHDVLPPLDYHFPTVRPGPQPTCVTLNL